MGSEVIKNLTRTFTQVHIGGVLLVGFFLILLTYFTVSEQFDIRLPSVFSGSSPANPDNNNNNSTSPSLQEKLNSPPQPGNETKAEEGQEKGQAKKPPELSPLPPPPPPPPKEDNGVKQPAGGLPTEPICDLRDFRYDVCDMTGDARVLAKFSTVLFVPSSPNSEAQEWKIKTQSRKYVGTEEVTVKQLHGPHEAPPCSANHSVPAVIFSVGALTGNFWHDFSDVIVPLFITSREFNGDVQFLIADVVMRQWFVVKYAPILKALSRFDFIDFDRDDAIRCFPRVTVALRSHGDLWIDPKRSPNGYTLVDFRRLVRNAYALGPDTPVKLEKDKKPRLMLIARGGSRKITNVPEVVELADRLGFEVAVVDPKGDHNMTEFAKKVNSSDVFMGVHGAGMTNMVFLRMKAVMIQVVPYGKLEGMAEGFIGDPAKGMGMKYLQYSIAVEESSLLDKYGRDDPIVKDPESVHKAGWKAVGDYYMWNQDVRLDINRFQPVLVKALELLKE
ncbi:beta-1,2-xylosyltransferase XYXT1-like [Typha angustifolia]|uniref:beta-1,2-xylosyltransferase XYXT1-like n=1 Tax=Typha angustifolia TaxID=59011 RepID=UPI003C2FDFB7